MPTYPVSLVLQDRAALVVGGGAVATRKVEGLLPAGAHVTVVAPEVTEALRALADAGRCAWRAKAYDAADLSGADIVFVATDDEDVNAQAYRDASGAHLMANVADRPELCTFFLPSVLRRELEERIPAGFEAYLDLLAAWRPRAIAALPDEPARLRFWQQATDGRVQRLVQAADEEAAERLLEELLEAERTACSALL